MGDNLVEGFEAEIAKEAAEQHQKYVGAGAVDILCDRIASSRDRYLRKGISLQERSAITGAADAAIERARLSASGAVV